MIKSVLGIRKELPELHPLLNELFHKMPGIGQVDNTHGNSEMGADFVFSKRDLLLEIDKYVGVIAKVGDIVQDNTVLERQIGECLLPRFSVGGKRKIILDEIWVIVTGKITHNAREKIYQQHKGSKVDFIEGNMLDKWVKKYIPYYWGIKERNPVRERWNKIITGREDPNKDADRQWRQLIRSEKLSAVGQLISGIAQELNSPLQTVVGYCDHVLSELNSAEGGRNLRSNVKVIFENGLRCQKIIENLLLFVESGNKAEAPVDIKLAIESSTELLRYKIKQGAILLYYDFPKQIPSVWGDYRQIQQVFVNLINNACDALKGSTQTKKIHFTVRNRGNIVHIEVVDSGVGIAEEDYVRIFEPFFTTKPEGKGTGLGLPVCKQIVEDHGGKIGFTSKIGFGSTFWIELPKDNPR